MLMENVNRAMTCANQSQVYSKCLGGEYTNDYNGSCGTTFNALCLLVLGAFNNQPKATDCPQGSNVSF